MTGQRESAAAPADGARLAPPRHDLIGRHMGLAARVAMQYRGRRLDDDELEALAYCALVEAATRYDVAEYPEQSFARFAERSIRTAIRDALCAAPVVHMGRNKERAVLRGEATGPAPYAVGVEALGLVMRSDDGTGELLGLALADCTELQRDLIALVFVERRSTLQAGRELGLSAREARAAYDAALETLAASLRAHGYEPPAGAMPRLAESN